jgi:hypothetical protein
VILPSGLNIPFGVLPECFQWDQYVTQKKQHAGSQMGLGGMGPMHITAMIVSFVFLVALHPSNNYS